MNNSKSLGQQFLMLLGITLCCSFLGSAIGRLVILTTYGDGVDGHLVSNSAVIIELGISQLFTFIGSFIVFAKLNQLKLKSLFVGDLKVKWLLLVFPLAFLGIIISNFLAAQSVTLFEGFGFYQLIDLHQQQQEYLMNVLVPEGMGKLVISVVVMALIPAIGEELIFRGLIQNIIMHVSAKKHFTIIVTATIFAGLHFQPINLISIFFMGLLIGYIYHYTRNLIYPMLFHFLINGSQVCMIYFYPDLIQ